MSNVLVDHIGIATESIEASSGFWELLGFKPVDEHNNDEQGVRIKMLKGSGLSSRLELLEPLGPDTAVGRFIQRRGEGLHHLALNVSNVGQDLDIVKERGLRVIDRTPREGLTGMVAFIHPESTGGILMELVQSIEQ